MSKAPAKKSSGSKSGSKPNAVPKSNSVPQLELATASELAQRCGISSSTLIGYCVDGLVPFAYKAASIWLIPAAGCDFIAKSMACRKALGSLWSKTVAEAAAQIDPQCNRRWDAATHDERRLSLVEALVIRRLGELGYKIADVADVMDIDATLAYRIITKQRYSLGKIGFPVNEDSLARKVTKLGVAKAKLIERRLKVDRRRSLAGSKGKGQR